MARQNRPGPRSSGMAAVLLLRVALVLRRLPVLLQPVPLVRLQLPHLHRRLGESTAQKRRGWGRRSVLGGSGGGRQDSPPTHPNPGKTPKTSCSLQPPNKKTGFFYPWSDLEPAFFATVGKTNVETEAGSAEYAEQQTFKNTIASHEMIFVRLPCLTTETCSGNPTCANPAAHQHGTHLQQVAEWEGLVNHPTQEVGIGDPPPTTAPSKEKNHLKNRCTWKYGKHWWGGGRNPHPPLCQ